MTELSDLAARYLRTLERVPTVPTSRVESELERSGVPCSVGEWLAFHEEFAGYVEPLGRDAAVWGVMHPTPQWLEPFALDIEPETDGVTFYIACADAHPSYSYQLSDSGELLALPAERFSVHVERCAAGWEFGLDRSTRALTQAELRDAAFVERCAAAEVLEPASDGFARYLRDDQFLVIWRTGAEHPQRAWRRE